MANDAPIPVTVLTGFLGAGKTTLLNRILHEQHGRKLAVIENEFGEVGVDNQLVIQSEEELFEMNNGCICCSVRGDLIRILGRLLKRKDRLDGILIETTGLADPGPVAQTFFTDEEMRSRFRLDSIVTVVDTRHILQQLGRSPEASKQIAFADVLILNKTDLIAPADLDALEARIKRMNAAAKVHRAVNANVPLSAVLDVGGFNLGRAKEVDPAFLEPEYPFEWAGVYPLPAGKHELVIGHGDGDGHDHADHDCGHAHHHGNADELDVVLMPVKSLADADVNAALQGANVTFSDWEAVTEAGETFSPGSTLRRLKLKDGHAHFGLEIAEPMQVLVCEGCGEHPLHIHVAGDPVKPVWQKDFPHRHHHDDEVQSVGIQTPGNLDGKRLNDWIGELLKTKGNDLYRMKGVLSIQGSNKRLVFQGVHMLFDARFDREWGTDARVNTLVFIGKGLDRNALNEGFRSCLA